MVRDRLQEGDVEDGFLLDGYPCTTAHADYLDDALFSGGQRLNLVVQLTVDDEELVARLLRRARNPAAATIMMTSPATACACTTRRRKSSCQSTPNGASSAEWLAQAQ
jgi:adenylate kinase family enzyme